MTIDPLRKLIIDKENPASVIHSARTTVAAVLSLLVARLFRLPEAYWAPLTTIIIMQSTLGAALPISAQRFAGTVLGAAAGGLLATYFPGNVLAIAAGVFLIGIPCAGLRVQRSAYRFAGITLTILMLVPHSTSGWAVAVHRFTEVSVGIAVGLFISALWPERQPIHSSVTAADHGQPGS